MKKVITILLTILITILLLPNKASAQPLGGLSLMLEQFYARGGEIYSDEDLNLLSEVIYYENFWNGDYIMRLTGSVVLNRVKHPEFPNTIKGVLYQKGQYATVPMFFKQKIPKEVREIARDLLIGGSICPDNVIFQAQFKQGRGIYYVENGEYFCY